MRVTLAALIAALIAAPVAAAASGPVVRLGPAPIIFSHGPGEHHAFWRGGDGGHDFGRHHRRHAFLGLGGPVAGDTVEPGPEPTPSPFVISAPIFVNVTFETFAPAVEPQRDWSERDWSDGPKLIEIGRQMPLRRHLPLVVYGE
jgi:hypothetical protein